jgi:hypothetical protein
MSVLVRVYAISPNNLNITFRRIVVLHSHGSPSIVAETLGYSLDFGGAFLFIWDEEKLG